MPEYGVFLTSAVHAVLVEVPVVGLPFLSKCYSFYFHLCVWLVQVLFQDGAISLQDSDHPLPPQGNCCLSKVSPLRGISAILICICILFLVKDRRENYYLFVFHSQLWKELIEQNQEILQDLWQISTLHCFTRHILKNETFWLLSPCQSCLF